MLDVLFVLYHFVSIEQRKQYVKCMYRFQAFDLLHQNDARCRQLTENFVGRLVECASELSVEQFRIVWTRIPASFLIKYVSRNFIIIDVVN